MPAQNVQASSSPIIHLTSDYTLTDDITFDWDGFYIEADGITLNLNGHTIYGSGHGLGVHLYSHTGVTIKNGTITNFDFGIALAESADNNNIKGIVITNNSVQGISLWIGCDNNEIKNCTVANNGHNGIIINEASNYNIVKGNVSYNNALDGISVIKSSSYNVLKDNVVIENGRNGINVFNSHYNVIKDNTTSGNTKAGIVLNVGADNNEVRDNYSSYNTVGIRVGWPPFSPLPSHIPPENNTIVDNTLLGNSLFDIFDLTSGSGTVGTANFYKDNEGDSSNPP